MNVARAGDDADADARETQANRAKLDEVVVTGYRFLDADTSGITNLSLPIEQVPQSIR